MKLCVTGHRPNKLWGYDYNAPQYQVLKDKIKNLLVRCIKKDVNHFVSGMALGVDTLFAEVVLELREEYDITLECAIPCLNQSAKWVVEANNIWQRICEKADKITYVSDQPYTSSCMQKRNEYMVDNTDIVLAIWDGTAGGTKNCVDYAKRKGKYILHIDPKQII
jgi:uncharacterized phage-like protein YoqJ